MENFKAIILAAGFGSRLMPLTKNIPKCMVKIKDKSILDRQLHLFNQLSFSSKIIVTGYLNEKINTDDLVKINNLDFSETNMVHSLFLAKDFMRGNVIISYGDIIYKKEVLQGLINDTRDIVIATDSKWKDYWEERFVNPLSDAESFIKNENQTVASLGQVEKNIEKIEGQFIGLIKLSNNGCKEFLAAYNTCISSNSCSKNAWNSNRTLKLSYMTDLLNFIAKKGILHYFEIERGWAEIDDLNDLKIAENMSWI